MRSLINNRDVELAALQQEHIKAKDEIAETEKKLTMAKQRFSDLREGRAMPRKLSRRISPNFDLLKEALQEVDSTIFTMEMKLKQLKERELAIRKRINLLNGGH